LSTQLTIYLSNNIKFINSNC